MYGKVCISTCYVFDIDVNQSQKREVEIGF